MRNTKYIKLRDPKTARKYYKGIVRKPTAKLYPKQLCNKRHDTATEASQHAQRVEARWERLLRAKNSEEAC